MDEIRKLNRSAYNRVQSIIEDTEYVSCVYETYKRPLIPNKRCGLWYVRPEDRSNVSYFKSTDGHTGQWSFSLKRLNLHLLPIIEENGGVIIVDSTRRGKLMPDALSKTIPIWCAVINYALFGMETASFPADCVSASERDQILSQIALWAEIFRQQVPPHLIFHITKPLKPMWTTPNSPLPMNDFGKHDLIFEDAHAIICCTASRKAQDGQIWNSGFSYVQGAADDHELWAPTGFTSEMLWEFNELRESGISDDELGRRITAIFDRKNKQRLESDEPLQITQVHPFISIAHAAITTKLSPINSIDLRSNPTSLGPSHWPLNPGKRGSKQLAFELLKICEFYESQSEKQVVVVSDPGTDFAECVALMLDCRYFTPAGEVCQKAKYVSKDEVTRRNLAIIAHSGLAPSRTTQNVVGSFLRK